MSNMQKFVKASQAAELLGVSTKALRVYEEHGLLQPCRSEAGYRMYGERDLQRGSEVVALRGMGLPLEQVRQALGGECHQLAAALAAREAQLRVEIHALTGTIDRIRALREGLQQGQPVSASALIAAIGPTTVSVTFALPWPWDGETFHLGDIRRLNYIVGPLGSGKTRFARCMAASLAGSVFLELDRGPVAINPDAKDPLATGRIDAAMAWLLEEGAHDTPALRLLVSALEADEAQRPVVVDMVEQGLDQPTQEALMQWLRQRDRARHAPIFLMTRSSSILDLALVGPDETIILCPANHGLPRVVKPYAGAVGYEIIESCLGTPQARARWACGDQN